MSGCAGLSARLHVLPMCLGTTFAVNCGRFKPVESRLEASVSSPVRFWRCQTERFGSFYQSETDFGPGVALIMIF